MWSLNFNQKSTAGNSRGVGDFFTPCITAIPGHLSDNRESMASKSTFYPMFKCAPEARHSVVPIQLLE
jgi:hypothetical protein